MKLFGNHTQSFTELYNSLFTHGNMLYVGTLLARAFRLFPDVVALEYEKNSITYKQLYSDAVAVSKKLLEYGVQPGDRIVIIYENSIDFYRAYYGAWQTGAIVAPLNTFLQDKELFHIISDAQPQALLISDHFNERLKRLDAPPLGWPFILSQTAMHELLRQQSSLDVDSFTPVVQSADVPAAFLYTSGTTGFPKGVMLSSRNILINVIQGLCLLQVSHEDKVLAALPLFHSFAQASCVWGSFFVGGTTIVVPRIERRALLEGLTSKPTFIVGVPALYGLFCLMKTLSFSQVRYFICGGDALPDKIRIGFELLYRRRLANGYGLTEAAPLVAVNFDDALLQPNTVGRLAQGITARLCDEHGREVSKGEKGILWIKGENIMLGYYNAEQETAKVLKDGWLDTGDWAFFDNNDRLVIAGRHKDLIVHKGFNIYPPEIENVILSHPLVMQVAVVGKMQEDVGEIPVAFIVAKEGVTIDIEQIKKICHEQLASYKIPRAFYFLSVDELPLTPLKKIDKKKLRHMLSAKKDFTNEGAS